MLLSLAGAGPAKAGDQCLEGTVEIYTTMHNFIEAEGYAMINACVRSFFPPGQSVVPGWSDIEGTFVQLDPNDPTSWNSADGLARAIEACYGPPPGPNPVPTWPFFPPGSCGLPMHPTYEGEFDPTGLAGREWVMRWYLTDQACNPPPMPPLPLFEAKVQIVRQEFCLDLLRNGFEE